MTATMFAGILPGNDAYKVAFVSDGDSLNIRSGPGVANDIVGTLVPYRDNLSITGPEQIVSGSTWVPISDAGINGWVNSRFLTGQALDNTFCTDPAVLDTLSQLETAIINQDSQSFRSLIHPERGLKLHTYWWNPEVRISGSGLNGIFSNNDVYDWGVEDGSGLPITGTFREVILPQLQEDFLGADERVCNEIATGSTAGLITLPDGYQQIQYFSYHRSPQEDGIGFDWGTWVVGIESWQSDLYVSYFVHYNWEI